MFERFTDKARRVVVLCQEEARRYNHHQIGTEHLLLAFTHEDTGLGRDLLSVFGVDFDQLREKVVTRAGEGAGPVGGHIPFTAASKRTLELALREALEQGVNYVATEHLLLGLLRSADGMGAKVLAELGISHEAARTQIAQLTGVQFHGAPIILFQAGETVYPTRDSAEEAGPADIAEVTVELRTGEAFAVADRSGHFHSADFYLGYAAAHEVYAEHREIMDLHIVVMSPSRTEVTALDASGRRIRIGTVQEMTPLPLKMRTTPKGDQR